MKRKLTYLAIMLLVLGVGKVSAKTQSTTFKVNGKCDMCKKRIENAVNQVNGAISANWNKTDRKISVQFDDTKTNLLQIQTAIAMIGHDNERFSASDKGYDSLPGCCHYTRDKNRKLSAHKLMNTMNELQNQNSEKTECVHDKGMGVGSCCEK